MTTNLTIRAATLTDRAALEALQWRASLNNPGDRDSLLANPDAIELPADQIAAGRVFVAERQGVIVGFAAVLPRTDGNVELDGLFVEPVVWRSGVGQFLVAHCAAAARAQRAAALHVIGNPHAAAFYIACGFEIVGEYQTRFGVGILMQKTL